MKQENEVSKFIKKLGIETDVLGRVIQFIKDQE